jgi:peptide-methionine (S)-S-oxide reductase
VRLALCAGGRATADPGALAVSRVAQFQVAEKYHQKYFENNPNQPYCQFVVAPKVAKFRTKFAQKMKKA